MSDPKKNRAKKNQSCPIKKPGEQKMRKKEKPKKRCPIPMASRKKNTVDPIPLKVGKKIIFLYYPISRTVVCFSFFPFLFRFFFPPFFFFLFFNTMYVYKLCIQTLYIVFFFFFIRMYISFVYFSISTIKKFKTFPSSVPT